ncbi:phosphoesterase PA-phosphatase [Planosporangium sp. 12N6]|uniref:phosphoesterase PA-phosphatase n=1 Tax=Planosporangium spinosum TaxID=3402278 RepID=UPI003CEE03B0
MDPVDVSPARMPDGAVPAPTPTGAAPTPTGAADTPTEAADTQTGAAPTPAERLARVVTEVFAPAVLAATMPVVIGVHAAPTVPAGLGWAALALLFSAVVPYAIVRIGMRLGKITDHHIGVREQRRIPLLFAVGSVLIGLAILAALHAPRELIAMVVVMLVVLVGIGAVNLAWKLSAHAAVASGSATVLVLVFGPALLATGVLVALIGWSRVRLRDHTAGQVVAGALLGVPFAAVTFVLLR